MGGESSPSLHIWQLWVPLFPRLDEDGKVLTPEELLYRVGRAMGGVWLLGWQLGHLCDSCVLPGSAVCECDS